MNSLKDRGSSRRDKDRRSDRDSNKKSRRESSSSSSGSSRSSSSSSSGSSRSSSSSSSSSRSRSRDKKGKIILKNQYNFHAKTREIVAFVYIITMKGLGLDTVESLSAGTARDPNCNNKISLNVRSLIFSLRVYGTGNQYWNE